MSVSISIYAIQAGERHTAMVAAAHALTKAGVEWPGELHEYFGEDALVDDAGRLVHLTPPGHDGTNRHAHPSMSGYDPMYNDGCLIDLSKLPPGTTHLRVRMS